jgi:serine/threonine-protein phosphatase PP1 catalytic subunit
VYALDWIIDKFTGVKNSKWGTSVDLDAKAIKFIIDEAATTFSNDNMLVEITAPVKVFGDTHGQYFDLFRLFEIAGWPSKDSKHLFIGDYVDRGK